MADDAPGRDSNAALRENIRLSSVEAPVYDRNHFEIFHPWEQRRLRREVTQRSQARRVLDIGAGTGNVISKFPRSIARVAADLSAQMLMQARTKDRTLHLVQAEGTSLPFMDGSFDLVVSYSTLHHLADTPSTLRELQRVLTPGGTLILDHEESFQARGWRGWFYRMLRQSLRAIAATWYWRQPTARPWLPYRRVHWPLSVTFGPINFKLAEGGRVDAEGIEEALRREGFQVRRCHYLLEPLPMESTWQAGVDLMCHLLSMGHFFVEARKGSQPR